MIARPMRNRVQRPIDLVPEQNSSSTPPVIRVTIGRIDVRAELAAAEFHDARSNRPSTLSLDQYLNDRERPVDEQLSRHRDRHRGPTTGFAYTC